MNKLKNFIVKKNLIDLKEQNSLYEQIQAILNHPGTPIEFYDAAVAILHPKEIIPSTGLGKEKLVSVPSEKTIQPLKPILRQPKATKIPPSLKSPKRIRKELLIKREREEQLKKSLQHLYENLTNMSIILR